MSSEVAFPLLIKKLPCLGDILAPPTIKSEQLEDPVSKPFCLGFLNVLPRFNFAWLAFVFLAFKIYLFFFNDLFF